ncbi:MAG: hypothetical protein IPK50_13200 [Fibrobacterota bacterium]|nr:hypothetical protein [Fibrobacterota bacterium]QQS03266.1 MAG: hypothetical protein IPK50_13200 [Fibrobacterota bacterium]
MNRPHSLNVLEACLERLELANRDWIRLATEHHGHLVANRLSKAEALLEPMEGVLLRIDEDEDVRLRTTMDLASDLALEADPPPRLEILVGCLGPEGEGLRERGLRLRATIVEAAQLASRVRGVAEIGWKITETSLQLVRAQATAASRPPAAYVAGGRRTTGTAVPVFQRAWSA